MYYIKLAFQISMHCNFTTLFYCDNVIKEALAQLKFKRIIYTLSTYSTIKSFWINILQYIKNKKFNHKNNSKVCLWLSSRRFLIQCAVFALGESCTFSWLGCKSFFLRWLQTWWKFKSAFHLGRKRYYLGAQIREIFDKCISAGGRK